MRILIIEDEHRIANTIKKGLEQEAYTVDLAYNGNDGYDLASGEEYDVIILDILLPGINGIDICKRLRKEKKHTPILVLTAKSQTEDKITGLNCGADDYVTKPFSFEELLARVKALARRPATIIENYISIGDLSIDRNNHQVKRANISISLSRKEYALFEYLMRNAGRVVTKEQIIRYVWDYDADILPNTVEATIRNLRKKIDTPFRNQNPYIQTVRGFGYMIQA